MIGLIRATLPSRDRRERVLVVDARPVDADLDVAVGQVGRRRSVADAALDAAVGGLLGDEGAERVGIAVTGVAYDARLARRRDAISLDAELVALGVGRAGRSTRRVAPAARTAASRRATVGRRSPRPVGPCQRSGRGGPGSASAFTVNCSSNRIRRPCTMPVFSSTGSSGWRMREAPSPEPLAVDHDVSDSSGYARSRAATRSGGSLILELDPSPRPRTVRVRCGSAA